MLYMYILTNQQLLLYLFQLQLSAQQLQMIRMQLGAAGNGQQIVLQAAAPQQGQQE